MYLKTFKSWEGAVASSERNGGNLSGRGGLKIKIRDSSDKPLKKISRVYRGFQWHRPTGTEEKDGFRLSGVSFRRPTPS
jgi:hypothetical protein